MLKEIAFDIKCVFKVVPFQNTAKTNNWIITTDNTGHMSGDYLDASLGARESGESGIE